MLKYYSLRSYLHYLSRYKWRAAWVFVMFVIANGLLAVMPLLIGKLIGSLAATPVDRHHALIYMWALIGCSTVHEFFWHVGGELSFLKLLNRVSYDYETFIFRKVIRQPYPYFVGKFTGKISSYITTLSDELRNFTENIFWEYTGQVISLVTVSIILLVLNWRTGLVFITGLCLIVLVGRKTIIYSFRYEKQLADVRSTKNGRIIDAIANFVNVKSFQKETAEIDIISEEQAAAIATARKAFIGNVLFWSSMGTTVRNIIWPAAIGLNVYLFLHHQISITDITAFLSAILIFSATIWEAIWHVSQFNLQLARIEEAHTYLFGPADIVQQGDLHPDIEPVAFTDSLRIKDLDFAYPDNAAVTVLHNFNLELHKGDKIGIVGKSGSGKTTLTKLLLDYYQIPEAALLIDGQPASSRSVADLISYVPQDTSLFHRSIADNIAYATNKKANRADIIKAAKQANAHEFISQIQEGYEVLVGERGVKLSAGQRQRIAIARAFLDDKPILILDEATSALDSESEVLVQQALENLWHNKTVIAIAHRLSTLRNMDRIIVMDKGRIIEQGSHEQLLVKKGKYAKLWAHQSDGFLSEQ